jgi:hypothetical protein
LLCIHPGHAKEAAAGIKLEIADGGSKSKGKGSKSKGWSTPPYGVSKICPRRFQV